MNSIEVTEVQIYPMYGYNTLKAYAKVVINGCLIIKDIKIINNDRGMFISMPSKKNDGHFYDIVHPTDQNTRKYMEDIIVNTYTKMMEALKVEKPI